MRAWVIPVIAASFVGAVLAGNLAIRTPEGLSASSIRAALPSGLAAGGDPRLASAAFTTAARSCAVPAAVTAAQVILVTSSGTSATVTGCSRDGDTYRRTVGPFAAHVGYMGVAPAGEKREGDGRTPTGTFRMGQGFGTARSPGVALGWLRVGSRDVWVDDPHSALYNTHQRLPAKGRWQSAEQLKLPAYKFAQAVRYNPEPIPGRGSAIFMHVGTTPTAGCVALPVTHLVKMLRWEGTDVVMVIS